MKNSKVLAFIFGLIPMTLLQYYYWGWLTDELMNGTSVGVLMFMLIPAIVTLIIYCVYEKFVLYSFVCADGKFRDTIPLAVIWVLECVIGTLVSAQTISAHWHDPEFGPGLTTASCPIMGIVLIFSFEFYHVFLYSKNKEAKKVLLVMLALLLLDIIVSALMDY